MARYDKEKVICRCKHQDNPLGLCEHIMKIATMCAVVGIFFVVAVIGIGLLFVYFTQLAPLMQSVRDLLDKGNDFADDDLPIIVNKTIETLDKAFITVDDAQATLGDVRATLSYANSTFDQILTSVRDIEKRVDQIELDVSL